MSRMRSERSWRSLPSSIPRSAWCDNLPRCQVPPLSRKLHVRHVLQIVNCEDLAFQTRCRCMRGDVDGLCGASWNSTTLVAGRYRTNCFRNVCWRTRPLSPQRCSSLDVCADSSVLMCVRYQVPIVVTLDEIDREVCAKYNTGGGIDVAARPLREMLRRTSV